ncbi:MAG: lipopolysaccharide biosynthesis protein [Candidatus Eisenbacteria bacterium]
MKRAVVRGMAWVGSTMFLDRAIRYLALLVLGGLLAPRDFGLFAALNVIIAGLALLQGFGIGQALICRKDRSDEAANTAFYVSAVLGVALAAVAWSLAPVVASFYREEALVELFRAASVILVIRALKLVPYYLFEKALDFKRKFIPGLCASATYLVVALILAYKGKGAWALVVAEIVSSSAEGIAYWIISPWRPRLRFDLGLARQDLTFGWVVLGGGILIFALRSLDRVVVSRVLGTHELGLYAFAFMIANLPAMLFTRVMNTVLFPSYSALGEDRKNQGELFFRATSYLSGMGALFVLGLLSCSGYVLHTLYGDKWMEAVLPLSVLSVFGFFRALTDLSGDLLIGTGNPVQFRKVNALQLALAAAGLYAGAVLGGLPGVALAMVVAAVPSLGLAWRFVNGIIGGGVAAFVRALKGPMIAFAALIFPALGLVRLLPEEGSLPAAGAAIVAVTAGYVAIWLGVDPALRADVAAWRAGARLATDDRRDRV